MALGNYGFVTNDNFDNPAICTGVGINKYNSNGDLIWSIDNQPNLVAGICFDKENHLYSTGNINIYSVFGNGTIYGNKGYIAKLAYAANINEQEELTHSSIFPNPSDGNFTLQLNDKKYTNLKIFNQLGQIVFSKNIYKKQEEIQLRNLGNGIYFLQLNSNQITETKKIIIER